MALRSVQGLIAQGVSSGSMVQLVYLGSDPLVRTYVVDGNVYQFGNTDRRRVNAVAARVAPFFLDPLSPYYGLFAEFDPALYDADGTPIQPPPNLPQEGGTDQGLSGEAGAKKKKGA